jgi:hypothetical protein
VCGSGTACSGGVCRALLLYTFSGVQQNVPVASLSGWTQCYSDLYSNSSTNLTTIQASCNQAQLMLACRPVGATSLTAVGYAPRADVLFDTGTGNVTHNANGVGWYYNGNWSWGFVQAGDAVNRNSCDIATTGTNGARLCWHTAAGNINGGYRCGVTTGLNGSTVWERLVYQAP